MSIYAFVDLTLYIIILIMFDPRFQMRYRAILHYVTLQTTARQSVPVNYWDSVASGFCRGRGSVDEGPRDSGHKGNEGTRVWFYSVKV